MTTTCTTGTWRASASLADDTVTVSRCDGCGDLLAVHGFRGFDFPAGTPERTILTTIWTAIGRSVDGC